MSKTILLIDDDVLVLKSIQNVLAHKGYNVLPAKNGQEAEALLISNDIQLIISDIRMPGRDGIEVAKTLKRLCAEKLKRAIPFIFVTGYASEEAPIDAVKLGAKDYILKPLDIDELITSVETHLA